MESTVESPAATALPLILFPGMGSDAALFQLQRLEFPDLIVPPWIMPRPGERLESYAERLAATLRRVGPCFVGGTSFGGVVALEVARHLPTRACLLIASIRSPRELSWRFRMWTPFARVVPRLSANVSGLLARGLAAVPGRWLPPVAKSALRQYAARTGAYQRWAAVSVLRWKPPRDPLPFPVLRIHGDRDRVFPQGRTPADTVVPGGGHLLTLTHPFAVNAFLRRACRSCEPLPPSLADRETPAGASTEARA